MTNDLQEAIKDGVAVLTLNRPERLNAMSRPMLDALLEALPRLAEDPEVGAVVLTGAGRGFCAGGDVKAMAEGQELGATRSKRRRRPCAAAWRCPAGFTSCPSPPSPWCAARRRGRASRSRSRAT